MNLGGTPYKAWIKLDFDRPKDRHNNFNTNQYHDPSYGFNLEKALEKYTIRELDDPAKKQDLMQSLQNGNRPVITTQKEGQDVKLHLEAVPRYGNINFFAENGRPEKWECAFKRFK